MAVKPIRGKGTPLKPMPNPVDFIRKNDKDPKNTYVGWNVGKGADRPDFGYGQAGPGIPYQEALKRFAVPGGNYGGAKSSLTSAPTDAKTAAIRRRLAGA